MTLHFDLIPSPEYPNGHWHARSDVLHVEADGESATEALTNLLITVETSHRETAS